jgi:hypothetical protein
MEMDELRRRIKRANDAKIVEYKELSGAIGKNHAYIQQFVTRSVPAELREEHVRKITGILEEREAAGPRRIVGTYDPDSHEDGFREDGATFGSETGVQGIPPDASAQLDLTGGLGAGGLSIVSEGVPGQRGMTFAAEQIRDYWRLPPAILIALGLAAHDVAIIPVQGDSMHPTLNEGDVVFIDTRHRLPSPAGLYALVDEIGGVVIKRLEVSSPPGAEQQTVSIISDNPRHGRKEWRAEDVQIIGRVLRKFSTIQ